MSAMSDFSLDESVGSCHSLHNSTTDGASRGMVHPKLRPRPKSGKRDSRQEPEAGADGEAQDKVPATLGDGDLWDKRQEALSVIGGFFDKEVPKEQPIAQKLRGKRAEKCKADREQTQARQRALREKRRVALESKLKEREKALERVEMSKVEQLKRRRQEELSQAKKYLDDAKREQQRAVAEANDKWLKQVSKDDEHLKLAFLKAQRRLQEMGRPNTVAGSAVSEASAQQSRDLVAGQLQAGRGQSAPAGPPVCGAGAGPLVQPRGKLKGGIRQPSSSPSSRAAARPTSAQRSAALSRPVSAARKLVAEGTTHASSASEVQRVAALERQMQHIQQQHAEKECEWEVEREQLRRQLSELKVLQEV
jgi:hypothetical protein